MASDTTYVTLTKDSFDSEVLKSTEPVLVDFWAEWCGPCHQIAATIEELAAEFEGRAKVGKLNVDDNAPLAAQYGIWSIPSLLLFKDGQVVDQVIGVVPKRVLADKLDGLLRPA